MPGNITVLDDCYNSNPRAMECMIETLAGWTGALRRIVVAGEMLELGPHSDSLHAECGAYAADHGVDMVAGVQGAARKLVCAAAESRKPGPQTHFFSNSDSAADFVCGAIRPGDLLLIKGSRGVHTERIVKRLLSEYESLN